LYEESSVGHRTALVSLKLVLFLYSIVHQARLILLVPATKFDLQDLSHGKSGLTKPASGDGMKRHISRK
jgi:hypothetical protein